MTQLSPRQWEWSLTYCWVFLLSYSVRLIEESTRCIWLLLKQPNDLESWKLTWLNVQNVAQQVLCKVSLDFQLVSLNILYIRRVHIDLKRHCCLNAITVYFKNGRASFHVFLSQHKATCCNLTKLNIVLIYEEINKILFVIWLLEPGLRSNIPEILLLSHTWGVKRGARGWFQRRVFN